MQELEEKIGYTFKTPKLLQQALTHSSFTPDIHKNYERLEFGRYGGGYAVPRVCQRA